MESDGRHAFGQLPQLLFGCRSCSTARLSRRPPQTDVTNIGHCPHMQSKSGRYQTARKNAGERPPEYSRQNQAAAQQDTQSGDACKKCITPVRPCARDRKRQTVGRTAGYTPPPPPRPSPRDENNDQHDGTYIVLGPATTNERAGTVHCDRRRTEPRLCGPLWLAGVCCGSGGYRQCTRLAGARRPPA